ncbi:PepSY domain-containing protein, partial [Variovorax sp. 2RAF20]
ARATAQRFAGKPARWLETAERDQWTVPNGLNAWRPLHRIAIDDDAGTELYVSAKTGEVMRDTHRAERLWNWLGSVPHWLYFT